jgi:DAPG hydrolase PhiG domain
LVELEDANALLDPGPLRLETGIQRLPSGQLHVAARTDMPHCKGRMLEWWFRFAPDTDQYAWWHPIDHVSSRWVEANPRTHVGSTHIAEEKLGGDEVYALQIHFVEPTEIFDRAAVDEALASNAVSAFVCAYIGIGEQPPRDDQGRPLGGRLAHIARDTEDGMVLRSRFWLGAGLPSSPEEITAAITDDMGLGLMRHAHTEFKYLARFLPSLYIAGNRDTEVLVYPW